MEATENTFSLDQGFAIFQAYSKIAHFASQSANVSEADQAKMQIVHELLNSLITNYYEVVSYLSNIIIVYDLHLAGDSYRLLSYGLMEQVRIIITLASTIMSS